MASRIATALRSFSDIELLKGVVFVVTIFVSTLISATGAAWYVSSEFKGVHDLLAAHDTDLKKVEPLPLAFKVMQEKLDTFDRYCCPNRNSTIGKTSVPPVTLSRE